MASFEIVDSGKFSGGRSNFSQTCNLLSQYLKEKGSFGDLTLGLTPTTELKGAPTETMNFLSVIEKSADKNLRSPPPPAFPGAKEETQNIKQETDTAPLTIFYAGQVMVFNDFPADKAKEIFALASKSGAARTNPGAAFAPPHGVQSPAESATSVPNIAPPTFASAQPALDSSDLPIARKNSLARFLEKRRDRITANAPYPAVSKAAAAPLKQAKEEAWLGLGPQLPFQNQRNNMNI